MTRPAGPAMTSAQQAFYAGMKDALAKRPCDPTKYTSALLVEAYMRGFKRGAK